MNPDFISALKQIEKEREIPLEVICTAIEEALTVAYKRNYNSNQDVKVVINRTTGTIDARALKTVVKEVKNPMFEISLEAAMEIDPEAVPGQEVVVVVTPDDFGRIAAQTAKQVIVQRIREAERDVVFNEFQKRENTLVTCTVQRFEQKNYYTDLGKLEGVLPPNEQVPTEHFKYGDRFKALILKAQRTPRGPQILLSRVNSNFVAKLFEYEVPEIKSGLITIRGVVREPGNRSKIAVESRDAKVDPVGACVGPKGSRVQNIVDELKNEKIDIINWNADPSVFIANSLNPSKVLKVILDPFNKSALVIVPDNQLSLAIGREGQNVRLAHRLTGWKIDIKNETTYNEQKEEIDLKAFELARLRAEKEALEEDGKPGSEDFDKETEIIEEAEESEDVSNLENDEIFTDSYYEEEDLTSLPEDSYDDFSEEISEEAERRSVLDNDNPLVGDSNPRRKKRKERRVSEEQDETSLKKKKKTRRARIAEEDGEYGDYSW